MNTSTSIIALLAGPDQSGLVARTGNWIWKSDGNIIHASQHHDQEANVFFQRLEWIPKEGKDPRQESLNFQKYAQDELGMSARVALASDRPQVAIMVSKITHCLNDILLRWEANELRGTIACIVSNHPDVEPTAKRLNLPFYHVPVSARNKEEAEARQMEIFEEHQVELVLMARYMQILSDAFFQNFAHPVINIHHSFLPAFAGARPYHQAFNRGVKVIGATAHYATPDLDQGPIIHQEIAHVNHRFSIPDLIQKGKDLERLAFAEAVKSHLENKILVYNNKTVVFD